jgi:hypothetical protein
VQDTKGEALNYVSKKAKNEDEKVEGRNGWGKPIGDVGVVQIVVTLKLWLHSSQIADSTMAQTARLVTIYAREWQ